MEMNERIKELAEQAGFMVDQSGHIMVCFTSDGNDEVKKFAELIIKVCVMKCEVVANMATITNDGEMARKTKATADSCAAMIKQHFGVE
jgi:hypothetical protein